MKNNGFSGADTFVANASQKRAIEHVEGPAMVIAGPGSGKTFVLVQRLKYMIETAGIPPQSILVITFTKAAALEMQHRFMKLTDSSYPDVSFGTFHSVFYQMIRKSFPKMELNIANNGFKREIIYDALSFLYGKNLLSLQEYDDSIQDIDLIITEISRIKSTGGKADTLTSQVPAASCFDQLINIYDKRLFELGKLDFEDMINRCFKMLSDEPDILKLWKDRFKYILIDEYQDINMMQFKTISLLSGKDGNIFVVGDDDQSIYGFRGSDPGIMQGFGSYFGVSEKNLIKLMTNYRSAKSIIDVSKLVIKDNKKRIAKEMSPAEGSGQGKLTALKFKDKNEQSHAIAQYIKRLEDPGKLAVLFRTNSEGIALSAYLEKEGIKTNISEQKPDMIPFFKDKAVILCLDYLKFSVCGRKRNDFLKIMNKPQRYITREALMEDVITEKDVLNYYEKNKVRRNAVKLLFKQIEMIGHLRPSLAIRYLRKEVGLEKIFEGSIKDLDKLEKFSRNMYEVKDLLKNIRDLERKYDKEEKGKNAGKPLKDRVKIMTFHGSKGLEFEQVWLPDLNEGIIPSRSAVSESQTEEERRMLYVAMTRAKQALIMSYISGSEKNPMLPSRFLRPVRFLWEDQSSPSSGSSTSSSNSTSSRNESNASETASYSSSSEI
ncbi:MAG: ATP-dependent helicase [Butyrivibrio sp.]|nr:ATP-dependent helicase [Butyrivibrio sp.]